MAIFKNSTFGTIRKSIGDDVAYRMGGQNVLRKKPAQVKDAKTEKQLAQRNAVKKIVALYRELKPAIAQNFPERSAKHSAYNQFASINLKNAIVFNGAEATVKFEKLQVAKGSMPKPIVSATGENADGWRSISFKNLVDGNQIFATDKICVLAFDGETKKLVDMVVKTADTTTPITADIDGLDNVDNLVYFAFYLSADMRKASDSILAYSL